MSAADSDGLRMHYKELQENFRLTESGRYGQLVTASGNSVAPLHRWFHMKEAFSAGLLDAVLDDLKLSIDGVTCVDPFAGSGTIATSMANRLAVSPGTRARYYGAEVNPFLHLLASTKLRVTQSPPPDFELAAARVVKRALSIQPSPTPALSTFANDRYFDRESVVEMMGLVAAAEEVGLTVDPVVRDMLRIAVAASVEPSSRLRRDGRTLRVVSTKDAVRPMAGFCDVVSQMAQDVPHRASSLEGRVAHADAREPLAIRALGDLAVFSPPYPNNIDYTEVYKLEAWTLALVSTHEEFSALRRRTLRSHGSLRWNAPADPTWGALVEELAAPVNAAVPDDRYAASRHEVVDGYLTDMCRVLVNLRMRLRPGAQLVCVVGNSLHGRNPDQYVIASDLLIAELARRIGFTVTRIEVARYPRRRRAESEFLRESVIFAQAPL